MKLAIRGLYCLAALGVALLLGLFASSLFVSIPEQLRADLPATRRIEDRDGMLLARTSTESGEFSVPLRLEETGPYLTSALIAAEDKRFTSHPGVDFLAISRATAQLLWNGKIISGASTITQQLARTCFERKRNLTGKWHEMALALSIERELSKDDILELYLNRVHFGPKLIGARAAADHYFGKPLTALDLAEAATLAGLVRGPSLYDPRVRPQLAEEQRNRVLARMLATNAADKKTIERAFATPVELHERAPLPGAHHWVRVVAQRTSDRVIHSTLHGQLQRDVEALALKRQRALSQVSAAAAAIIVIDNDSGEVLAYVGSPDFKNKAAEGQNDGVRALRQPGSALKPFIYAQAIDELGLHAASILPDEPKHFRTKDSFYAPRNFDRKFRGDVLFRRALSNSLNVPAVFLVDKLGGARVLGNLRSLGLSSLDKPADYYGPALALGDGEVSLEELTAAYAALARGGRTLRLKFSLDDAARHPPRQVFSPAAAAIISEILSDDAARREAFGATNSLDLPFPVAVKTGTSKGYRDNWTVGYTKAITVGVWVGNFDGRPTQRLTGATSAGPLFHEVMEAAVLHLGDRVTAPGSSRPLHDAALVKRTVCAESGEIYSAACQHRVEEWFAAESPVGSGQSFQHFSSDKQRLSIEYPQDGMSFKFDPAIPRHRQTLIFKARSGGREDLTLYINGHALLTQNSRAEWPVERGEYEITARTSTGASPPVRFTVN